MSSKLAGKKRARSAEDHAPAASKSKAARRTDVDLSGLRAVSVVVEDGEPPLSGHIKAAGDDEVLFVALRAVESDEVTAAFAGCDSVADKGTIDSADGVLYWYLLKFSSSKLAHKAVSGAAVAAVSGEEGTGLRGWLENYRAARVDARDMQAAVDKHMAAFDAKEEAKELAKKELAARMEADGFTLVTSKARVAVEGDDDDAPAANKKKKKSNLSMPDFYKFQRTQDKLSALAQLRAGYAEDKERLRQLKEARKFKPY